MTAHAALITVLNVLLILTAMGLVGRERGRHQVHAPAVTGHPDFERAFRAHQNTLEQTVGFLPMLWLATLYCQPLWAAILGYVWIVGRVWYLFGYISAANKRSIGFLISTLALLGLIALSVCGVVALFNAP